MKTKLTQWIPKFSNANYVFLLSSAANDRTKKTTTISSRESTSQSHRSRNEEEEKRRRAHLGRSKGLAGEPSDGPIGGRIRACGGENMAGGQRSSEAGSHKRRSPGLVLGSEIEA